MAYTCCCSWKRGTIANELTSNKGPNKERFEIFKNNTNQNAWEWKGLLHGDVMTNYNMQLSQPAC